MANGKVCTGFSKPYVALYSASGTTITYTSGIALARGVDVSIEPETSEDNDFYADNVKAETASGTFTGGTVNLTVDGLKIEAERLIMGLPAASDGWTDYNDEQAVPNVGLGFIARYQEAGVVSYVPVVLTKVQFQQVPLSAATQEEDIDWQTEALTATIMRGDDAKHTWKSIGADETTEAAAEAALKTKLGIQ